MQLMVALVLAMSGAPVDTSGLKHRFEDVHADIAARMQAAEGLRGVAGAEEALIRVLEDRREPLQLRIVALRTLSVPTSARAGLRHTNRAVGAAIRTVGSQDPVLRLEAIRALGRMGRTGSTAAVASLRHAFARGDAEARDAAASALGRMGRLATDALPDFRAAVFSKAPSPAVWAALEEMGTPAVPLLVEAMTSGPPRRDRAIKALRSIRYGAKAAVPALLALAATGDASAREALEAIGPTLGELAAALQGPDAVERRRALSGMSLAATSMGEDAAELVPALRAALGDPVPAVRGEAPGILAAIGAPAAPAVPDIVRMLQDSDAWVRSTAALALGTLAFKARQVEVVATVRVALQSARSDPDVDVRICVEQSLRLLSTLPDGVEKRS